jgi:hypothetical protein
VSAWNSEVVVLLAQAVGERSGGDRHVEDARVDGIAFKWDPLRKIMAVRTPTKPILQEGLSYFGNDPSKYHKQIVQPFSRAKR